MATKLVYTDLCGRVQSPVLSKKSTTRIQRTVFSKKSEEDDSGSTGGNGNVTVDSVLSANSTNAIQNQAVTKALAEIPKNTKNLIKNMLADIDYQAEDISNMQELANALKALFAALKAGG